MITIQDHLGLVPLGETDQPQLFALMQKIYPAVYAYLWDDAGAWYLHHAFGPAAFAADLADPRGRYYFVTDRAEPIGILRILEEAPLPEYPAQPSTKLHRIYLAASHQGRGWGQRLVRWVQQQYNQDPAGILWLEVMDSQPPAIAFYEKMGFQRGQAFQLSFTGIHPPLRGMYTMIQPGGLR